MSLASQRQNVCAVKREPSLIYGAGTFERFGTNFSAIFEEFGVMYGETTAVICFVKDIVFLSLASHSIQGLLRCQMRATLFYSTFVFEHNVLLL